MKNCIERESIGCENRNGIFNKNFVKKNGVRGFLLVGGSKN